MHVNTQSILKSRTSIVKIQHARKCPAFKNLKIAKYIEGEEAHLAECLSVIYNSVQAFSFKSRDFTKVLH